jgi:hypothetical protein
MNSSTDTMTAAEFNTMTAGASERQQQEALATWAAAAEAERPALRLLFHVPNGGNRTARSGARLKRMGAKAGVPDLCLPVMRAAPEAARVDRYGALWVEMKSGAGQLREQQVWWRDRLREIGHAHAVCRSWTEGRDTILSYLDDNFFSKHEGAL